MHNNKFNPLWKGLLLANWMKSAGCSLGGMKNFVEKSVCAIPPFFSGMEGQDQKHAFLRSGNWNNGANAGVFTVNLNNAPSNTNTNIGFRCAR